MYRLTLWTIKRTLTAIRRIITVHRQAKLKQNVENRTNFAETRTAENSAFECFVETKTSQFPLILWKIRQA